MSCDNNNMFDGDAEALFSVGRRFLNGNGVEKDIARAKSLLSQAASMGHPMAAKLLDTIREDSVPQSPAPAGRIKMYVMQTCPDCTYVERQIKGDPRYEIIDIGEHVRNLKEFLRLRDGSPVFDDARKNGYAGIPCFVKEDGSVTLDPADLGLEPRPMEGASCKLDGSGC